MTSRRERVARRLGAPECPRCGKLGALRKVEWRIDDLMPLSMCDECATALESLDADLESYDKFLALSDSISELTRPAEPLPSPSDTWIGAGSGDDGVDGSSAAVQLREGLRPALGSGVGLQGVREGLRDVPEHEDTGSLEVRGGAPVRSRHVVATTASLGMIG